MPKSLEEVHKAMLQLTLILLHAITYGFIIWIVLCHYGIIDCADRTPAACACHAVKKQASPQHKKSANPKARSKKGTAKKPTSRKAGHMGKERP